jgi:anti-sigma-K factor RskA
MNPDHAAWSELAAAAALDALDADDRAAFARHLAEGCDECAALERASRAAAAHLLEVPAPIEPPASLRARVVAAPRAPVRRIRPRGFADALVRFALAASIVAALYAGHRVRVLEGEKARSLERIHVLEDERIESLERIRTLETEQGRTRLLLARALNPDGRYVGMSGQGAAAGARATAMLDRASGALLLAAADLPALREDQGYELWWIDAGVPHPAGVFQPDASGRVLHEFHADQPLAESAVLAVTIEPRAGVAAPTGAIVLAQR